MPSINAELAEKHPERNEVERACERALDMLEAELTEVLKKYRATIGGCGCCGSPVLEIGDIGCSRDTVNLPRGS